jgi:sigma-E factor negative regulatory protein RseA
MNENLSAFVDDELDQRLSQQLLDRLHADADLRDEFALQVMIGDALRGDMGLAAGFTASVMSRLDDEPTVLAPVLRRQSSSVQRFWMPAAAAVAGVALVSWLGLDLMSSGEPMQVATVAATSAPVQVASRVEAPLRGYLVAHQGYSPTGSMQGVALYARGVSDIQNDDR